MSDGGFPRVGPALVYEHGGKPLRVLRCESVLYPRHVGGPHRPHTSVTVSSVREPFDGISAVLGFVREQREFAVASVPTSNVLDRDDVAPTGVPPALIFNPVAFSFVVRRPDQQCRHRRLDRLARVRPRRLIYISGEIDSVSGFDRPILGDDDAVLRGGSHIRLSPPRRIKMRGEYGVS